MATMTPMDGTTKYGAKRQADRLGWVSGDKSEKIIADCYSSQSTFSVAIASYLVELSEQANERASDIDIETFVGLCNLKQPVRHYQ